MVNRRTFLSNICHKLLICFILFYCSSYTVLAGTSDLSVNILSSPSNYIELGQTMTFIPQVSNADVNTCDWDFGDDSPRKYMSISESVKHLYTSSGDFTVTLTVTNSDGTRKTASQTIHVDAEYENSILRVWENRSVNNLILNGVGDSNAQYLFSYKVRYVKYAPIQVNINKYSDNDVGIPYVKVGKASKHTVVDYWQRPETWYGIIPSKIVEEGTIHTFVYFKILPKVVAKSVVSRVSTIFEISSIVSYLDGYFYYEQAETDFNGNTINNFNQNENIYVEYESAEISNTFELASIEAVKTQHLLLDNMVAYPENLQFEEVNEVLIYASDEMTPFAANFVEDSYYFDGLRGDAALPLETSDSGHICYMKKLNPQNLPDSLTFYYEPLNAERESDSSTSYFPKLEVNVFRQINSEDSVLREIPLSGIDVFINKDGTKINLGRTNSDGILKLTKAELLNKGIEPSGSYELFVEELGYSDSTVSFEFVEEEYCEYSTCNIFGFTAVDVILEKQKYPENPSYVSVFCDYTSYYPDFVNYPQAKSIANFMKNKGYTVDYIYEDLFTYYGDTTLGSYPIWTEIGFQWKHSDGSNNIIKESDYSIIVCSYDAFEEPAWHSSRLKLDETFDIVSNSANPISSGNGWEINNYILQKDGEKWSNIYYILYEEESLYYNDQYGPTEALEASTNKFIQLMSETQDPIDTTHIGYMLYSSASNSITVNVGYNNDDNDNGFAMIRYRQIDSDELDIVQMEKSNGYYTYTISDLAENQYYYVEGEIFDSDGVVGDSKFSVTIQTDLKGDEQSDILPNIEVIPKQWDLGTIEKGGTYSQVISMKNLGEADCIISSISGSSAISISDITLPYTLDPGMVKQFTVSLNTTLIYGNISENIEIKSNDPNEPILIIPISGYSEPHSDPESPPPENNYDWDWKVTDNPDINYGIDAVYTGPYCSNNWHIKDYDGDGYPEYYLVEGEYYYQWMYAKANYGLGFYIAGFSDSSSYNPWTQKSSVNKYKLYDVNGNILTPGPGVTSAYCWRSTKVSETHQLASLPMFVYTTNSEDGDELGDYWFDWGWNSNALSYIWSRNNVTIHEEPIHVTKIDPTFELNSLSPAQIIGAGESANYEIDLLKIGGFTAPVTLTCSGLPSDSSFSFSQNKPVPPSDINLTISTSSSTPAGIYTVTIKGTGGKYYTIADGDTRTTTVTLRVKDKAPYEPNNPSPSNSSAGISIESTAISWNGGHPDGENINYKLYLAKTSNPTNLVFAGSLPSVTISDLEYSTKYYWKVVSTSENGLSTEGPVWSFTTHSIPPNVPDNPFPTNGSIKIPPSIELNWDEGSDLDSELLTYDVYLDTTTNPTTRVYSGSESKYLLSNLNYNSTYYWKVIITDHTGAKTPGPIWQFKTDLAPPIVIVSSPEDDHIYSSNKLYFNATCDRNVDFYYTINGLTRHFIVSGNSFNEALKNLCDDEYNVTVYAIDEEGRVGIKQVDFSVESKSPEIFINSPLNSHKYTSEDIPLSLTADENLKEMICYLDGNRILDVDNNFSYKMMEGVADGEHKITVFASDLEGNSASKAISFVVDKQGSYPKEQWNRSFKIDEGRTENPLSIIQTSDGNYVIGSTSSVQCGLLKIDSSGNLKWAKTYDEYDFTDYFPWKSVSFTEVEDEGFLLAGGGSARSESLGLLLLKLSSDGNEEWSKKLDLGAKLVSVLDMKQISNEEYAIVGSSTNGYNFSGFVVDIDSEAKIEYDEFLPDNIVNSISKSFGNNLAFGTNNNYSICDKYWNILHKKEQNARIIQPTYDRGFILYTNGKIIKIDSSGNEQWNKNYISISDICPTFDGGYVLLNNDNLYLSYIRLIKLDAYGNEIWNEVFSSKQIYCIDVIQTQDNGFLVLGKESGQIFVQKISCSSKPEVLIKSPIEKASYSLDKVINISAVCPTAVTMWYSLNDGDNSTPIHGCTLDDNFSLTKPGNYILTIYGKDSSGNIGSSRVSFVAPMIINIHSPTEGYNYHTQEVKLNLSTNVDADIWYTLDGGSNSTPEHGRVLETTFANIVNGSHSLTIYANDLSGNFVSKSVNFSTGIEFEQIIFEDDFESYEVGSYPGSPWSILYSGSYGHVTDEKAYSGTKSYKAQGEFEHSRNDLLSLPTFNEVGYEIAICPQGQDTRVGFYNKASRVHDASITFGTDGKVYAGEQVIIENYDFNKWYLVRAEVDFDNWLMDVYIDRELVADNVSALGESSPTEGAQYTSLNLESLWYSDPGIYYDSIKVFIPLEKPADMQAPIIIINSPSKVNVYNRNSVELNVLTDELSTIWYSLNGGINSTPVESTSLQETLSGLVDNEYSLTVYAKDTAANINSSTVNFTVDTIVPAVIIDSPVEGNIYNTGTVELNVSTNEASTIWYNLNDDINSMPIEGINLQAILSGLVDNKYSLTVYAKDAAGNTGSSSVNFTVATVPPVMISINSPLNGYSYSTKVVSLNISTNVDADIWYSLDRGPNSNPMNGRFLQITLVDLTVGHHSLTVYANDLSGNLASETVNFTVKLEQIIFEDDIESYEIGNYPGSPWSVLYSGSYGQVTDEKAYSGTKSYKSQGKSGSSRNDLISLPTNDKIVYEIAICPRGQDTRVCLYNRNIDSWGSHDASVTFGTDGKVYAGEQIVLNNYDVNKWYLVRVEADFENWLMDVYIDDELVAGDISAVGEYSPSVGARYNSLNLESLWNSDPGIYYDSIKVFVPSEEPADTLVPDVNIYSPQHDNVYNTSNVGLNVSTNEASTIWYSLNGGLNSTPIEGIRLQETLTGLDDSGYSLTVYAQDTAGNTGSSSVNFIVDTAPPVITINSPLAGQAYTDNVELNISINEPSEIWYSVDGGENSTILNGISLHVSLSGLVVGGHQVNFYARDNAHNLAHVSVSFTVSDVDRPPELSSIGDKSVNENELLKFSINATDADSDAITYSATGLPTGASFDVTTATFSWTPGSGDAGNYNVEFIATANGLNDSETIVITVGVVNDWNPWNDTDSDGGEAVTLSELQDAIYDWRFGIQTSTGEMVDLSRLQDLIYQWRFG